MAFHPRGQKQIFSPYCYPSHSGLVGTQRSRVCFMRPEKLFKQKSERDNWRLQTLIAGGRGWLFWLACVFVSACKAAFKIAFKRGALLLLQWLEWSGPSSCKQNKIKTIAFSLCIINLALWLPLTMILDGNLKVTQVTLGKSTWHSDTCDLLLGCNYCPLPGTWNS